MISQQRGLEYKNNPQEDMAKLFEYEANLQCKDPEDVSWQGQGFHRIIPWGFGTALPALPGQPCG